MAVLRWIRAGAGPVVLACCAIAASVALGRLGPNPADKRPLVDQRIEDYRYDHATRCSKEVPKGTKALADWLARHTDGEFWGISRCEKLSAGNFSLHADGRAIDWHMDARDRGMKKQAMALIRDRFLATDRRGNDNALARRMGIQGIIYDCKSWWSSPGGLGRYSYCYKPNGKRAKGVDPTAAHVDHLHIELNKRGAAKKTSFWRSGLAKR